MPKKPLKHSERNKKVSTATRLKNSWSESRDDAPKIRIKPERHLIVTEGTKTEPNYFGEMGNRINRIYRGDPIKVEIMGTGRNTTSLYDFAKEKAESAIAGYTHVWLVYDKDSFSADKFNAVASMCQSSQCSGACFHAIWSNESFELWFLLHFDYLQSGLSREMYIPKLNDHLKKLGLRPYQKNDPNMYAILEPYLSTAIKNANKLEKENEGVLPADAKPGTQVHKLVGYLLQFLAQD